MAVVGELIDILPDPGHPAEPRPAAGLSVTQKCLATAVIAVTVLGLLRVNQVRAHPAKPTAGVAAGVLAAPAIPSGAPVRQLPGVSPQGTGSRLVLLGSTLTTYDVGSGTASRPLGGSPPQAILDAAALAGGDIVITPLGDSGRAMAYSRGGSVDLGLATEVIPGVAQDTAWLFDAPPVSGFGTVRLVDLAGHVLRAASSVPAGWRLRAATAGGLVYAVSVNNHPYVLRLRHFGAGDLGSPVARNVIGDVERAGHVIAWHPAGPLTVDGRADPALPSHPVDAAVSADGSEVAVLQPSAVALRPSDGGAARTVALPTGEAHLLAYAPSGWLFVVAGPHVFALAPGGGAVQRLPAAFADPPSNLLAAGA